jgi:hypothetical protein
MEDTHPLAIAPVSIVAASTTALSTFTMSLHQGWDEIPESRRPMAGDLVVLMVATRPETNIMGPGGWTRASDVAFYKVIGPDEPHPVFTAEGSVEWYVEGRSYVPLEGSSWL